MGVSLKKKKRGDVKVPRSDMNQVDLPDPVMDTLMELRKENEELHAQLLKLQKKEEKEKQDESI